jgi:YesN/AraC family two-component response regulator
VMNAESVFNAIVEINLRAPEYAVVDLRLGDGCGLDVISALKERQPDAHAIILTGYGYIGTAVRAVKLGAVDYLTKPADMDDIISILLAPKGMRTEAPSRPMSAAQVRWKHILQVHEFGISASVGHSCVTSWVVLLRIRSEAYTAARIEAFEFSGMSPPLIQPLLDVEFSRRSASGYIA